MGDIIRRKHGPEYDIREEIRDFLKAREWLVRFTHGNKYQSGFPDIFAYHPKWTYRWIDAKTPGAYSFTKKQRIEWPIWDSFGVGIWIMTAGNQSEYDKLFRPPNWKDYWKPSWGAIPTLADIDKLLDEIDDNFEFE